MTEYVAENEYGDGGSLNHEPNGCMRCLYCWFPQMDKRNGFEESPSDTVRPPTILAWRIGLFLLVSTIVQNFSYEISPYLYSGNPNYFSYTAAQQSKFASLVYRVLYWGPVFGLFVDLTRIFGERHRPVIIIASVLNALLFFLVFGLGKRIQESYYGVLMCCFIAQVTVMFIYIPMNAVVIRYGNNLYYNYFRFHVKQFYTEEEEKMAQRIQSISKTEYNLSVESSARVGGLMAQAMVWRSTGTFLYSIFKNFTYGNSYTDPHIPLRYFMLMAAIGSCILILQVLFLSKRKYFLDYRKSGLRESTAVQFYRNLMHIRRGAVSQAASTVGTNFMFVLCFIFLYFAFPDALSTQFIYSFSAAKGMNGFSTRWTQSNSILSSLGALLGAAAYAVWMYVANLRENRKSIKRIRLYLLKKKAEREQTRNQYEGGFSSGADGDIIVGGGAEAQDDTRFQVKEIEEDPAFLYEPWRANPFIIFLVGCSVWTFGVFFHFIGQMGSNNDSFNYRVFFLFQSFITQFCTRFAFMPALSLAALHAPFEYETTAFELFSVASSGGAEVSDLLSSSLIASLNASVVQGYWKFLLLVMFFRMFPLFIAVSLPKNREEVYRENGMIEDAQSKPYG